MNDKEILKAVEEIKLNMVILSEIRDNKIEFRKLNNKTELLKNILSLEYAKRKNLKLAFRWNTDYIMPDELKKYKDNMIFNGHRFNLKALRNGKRSGFSKDYYFWNETNEFLDHPYFYKDFNYNAKEIIAHLYGIPNGIEEWADERDLKISYPDYPSWYYPEATTIISVTARGIK